jgi:hypothetical protein
LVLLFGLALLPRLTGLISFHSADENWGQSARVLTGDLSGGTSQTLPLVNYLNAVSFVLLFAIGRLIGVWHGLADFRAQYFYDPTPFVFAGRFVAACIGALSGPLAVLIASRLGLSRKASLVVGIMVALLPVNVFWSHHAKPESGVASAVLFLAWSLLCKLDNPHARWPDVLVGLALALAISFKQTAIFVVAPLVLGFAALLRSDCRLPWSRIMNGFLIAVAVCVLAWIPMNIGVLMDIPGFLSWQRLTLITVEPGRPTAAFDTAKHAALALAKNVHGLTIGGLAAWILAPLARRDRRFLVLWCSTVFAYLAMCIASGPVNPRYYLPYDELAFTVACVAAWSLVEREAFSRLAGLVLVVAIVSGLVVGLAEIVQQAMRTPMRARCAEAIKAIADPERDRIPTADVSIIGVPISAAAVYEDRLRHERLAKKYGVAIPETPPERKPRKDNLDRGYYVRGIPYSMGGDIARESSLSSRMKTVMRYWWPLQPEEFKLDYWTTRGFSIFLLVKYGGWSGSGHSVFDDPLYQPFHQEIMDRCEVVAELPTTRPLFDWGVTIYRLRRPPTAEQVKVVVPNSAQR